MSLFTLRPGGRSPIPLLVPGGLLLALTGLIAVLVAWNSYRQAEAAARASMVQSARLLEQGLTRTLDSLDSALTRVAEPLDDPVPDTAEAMAAIRDTLRFAPHIRQILVLDTAGHVILDSAGPLSTRRAVADLAAWGLDAQGPRSLGSSLRIGTATPGRYLVAGGTAIPAPAGRWVIPVDVGGDAGYRVVAALNPDVFLRAFATALGGPVEEALLVRYDGAVLAAHNDSAAVASRSWGWSVDDALRAAVHDGTTDRLHRATPMAGAEGFVAFRLSDVYPLAVVLAYSDTGLRAAWLSNERPALLALAIAPILLVLLAVAVIALLRHRLRLRNELRVLSRVVEEAPVAVIVTDRDARIEFVNDSFRRLLGYQPSEVVGRTPALLRSGHTEDAVYRDLWQTILAGGVWHGEFLNRAKDGRFLWMAAAVSGVRDDDGMVRRFVAIEADITRHKQTEATLSAMIARLDTTNRELEQFARVSSHDLQEPLRMVSGYLSLLEHRYEGLLPAEAQEFIRHAINGAERMRGLLKDLLAYSQVSGRQVSLRAVDADKALRHALEHVQDKISETGAVVRADPLPMVLAEERNLPNLFITLIDNALIHCSPDRAPEVSITCAEGPPARDGDPGSWRITVADNGHGIAPRDHERVFRLFQHLQNTGEATGNGVGLAVARRIVERAGGTIGIDSDGQSGTRVHIQLPKVTAPVSPRPTDEATVQ